MSLKLVYGKKISFKNMHLRSGFKVLIDGGSVQIGSNCFFNNNCSINCMENITIGDSCIIGENVLLYDHNHVFKNKDTLILDQGFTKKPIKIGNNCWIGSGCIILAGTVIGDNVVVGAGIVLSGNIPSNVVVKRNKDCYYYETIDWNK